MSYYFFLDDLMLPVPPAKMSIKIKNRNQTINLINDGEVNMIKDVGLTEISFDARLPNREYPYADYDNSLSSANEGNFMQTNFSFTPASKYMERFDKLKTTKEPFRLIIIRMKNDYEMLYDTNMLVTLESYSQNEDAKDGIDVTCPLTFKQYKSYGTKECKIVTDADGKKHIQVQEKRMSETKPIPKAVKVKHQKSTLELVKGVSGGNLSWKDIMKKNGITNPNQQLQKGMVMYLG